MKLWTCTTFSGHWPVGTAAIVIANNVDYACIALEDDLRKQWLSQTITPDMLEQVKFDAPKVIVLNNGDY